MFTKLIDKYLNDIFTPEQQKIDHVSKFVDFIYRQPQGNAEVSRKVKGSQYNQARLSVGFCHNTLESLFRVIKFLSGIEGVNLDPMLEFLLQSDQSQIQLIVFGLELGASASKTRYKVHIQYYKHPRIVDVILNNPCSNPKSFNFLPFGEATVGFDLFLDGRTEYRVYVSFDTPQRYKLLFGRFFEPHIVDALYRSENAWLAWKNSNSETFVYFLDDKLDPIIDSLQFEDLDQNMLDFNGIRPYIFGTTLSDLQTRKLNEYNIYFSLA